MNSPSKAGGSAVEGGTYAFLHFKAALPPSDRV